MASMYFFNKQRRSEIPRTAVIRPSHLALFSISEHRTTRFLRTEPFRNDPKASVIYLPACIKIPWELGHADRERERDTEGSSRVSVSVCMCARALCLSLHTHFRWWTEASIHGDGVAVAREYVNGVRSLGLLTTDSRGFVCFDSGGGAERARGHHCQGGSHISKMAPTVRCCCWQRARESLRRHDAFSGSLSWRRELERRCAERASGCSTLLHYGDWISRGYKGRMEGLQGLAILSLGWE